MSFLLGSLGGIVEFAGATVALKGLYNEAKNVLFVTDNVFNKVGDIGLSVYMAISGKKAEEVDINNLDFTPEFRNTYDTFMRVATRTIPTWGKFCGPNYTGGDRDDDINKDSFNAEPVDELDGLCKNHDFQYALDKIPRNQALADKELLKEAEALLYNNKFADNDYLKALIAGFRAKLFSDLAINGPLPTIKLPNASDYFNNKGVYNNENFSIRPVEATLAPITQPAQNSLIIN